MRIRDSFHTYALITIVFWSLAYVFTRLSLQYFSAFPLGFLRCFVASIALLAVLIVARMRRPAVRDIPRFLLSGACGFAVYLLFFNKGCETVTAATSSVIICMVPVITAMLANFLYKEHLRPFQWLATGVSFAGVLLLTLWDGVFSINMGIVWLLIGALLLSTYNLLQRGLVRRYSAVESSAYSIFAGTVMLAVFARAAAVEVRAAPAAALFYIAIMGVLSSAAAYIAWSQAFAKAKNTASVGNYMFLTPFLTSLLGLVIADEVPGASTAVGGLVILLGLFLFHFGGRMLGRK